MADGQTGPVVATLPRPVTHSAPRQTPHGWWRWPALVGLLYLLVQAALAPAAVVYPDTARYAAAALEYDGASPEVARQAAVDLQCTDVAEQLARADAVRPVSQHPDVAAAESACRTSQADHLMPSGSPRYQALFDARPGYPMAAAFLAPLLGLKAALWAIPVAATFLAGVLVWVLLRQLGATPAAAAAGQALLYVLPTGWWGSQMLTEGPVLLGVTAAVLGGVLCLAGRHGWGSAVLLAGLAVTGLVKYSTATLVAAAVVAAVLVGGWRDTNRRGALTAATIAAAVGGLLWWMTQTHRLPGSNETLQDMFTSHFAAPDVSDPIHQLIGTDINYWTAWLTLAPMNLALIAGAAGACFVLWRVWRPAMWLVGAVALVGLAAAAAHPDPFEGGRLYSLAWLLPAVGLPLAGHLRRAA